LRHQALEIGVAPDADAIRGIGGNIGAFDEKVRLVPDLRTAGKPFRHIELTAAWARRVTPVTGHDGVDEVAAPLKRGLGASATYHRDRTGKTNHRDARHGRRGGKRHAQLRFHDLCRLLGTPGSRSGTLNLLARIGGSQSGQRVRFAFQCELFAIALAVEKQGESLGPRSTLAPWLTR